MGLGSFFKRGQKDSKTYYENDECHININISDCDVCEKCITACPNNVLLIKDGACGVRNSQACKLCRVCMAICPNECIKIN